jgi:hypothetical protein
LRAFIVACISRRAASHASSCAAAWSPTASSASSSSKFDFAFFPESSALEASFEALAAAPAPAAGAVVAAAEREEERLAPSTISFASETEMAAARSGLRVECPYERTSGWS